MSDTPIHIPFNKPYCQGKELLYIAQAVKSGKLSGNGQFTAFCQNLFQEKWGFKKCFLTSSCTDALEMVALLLDIQPGDEVILPSYTFVSCANAFVLRGAVLRFADSQSDHPNIDPEQIAPLITARTKAILVMHYGGVACDMERIVAVARAHKIPLIEDAAQCIDAYHGDRALGSYGAMSTFSFHETKNIQAGEGGMLAINDPRYIARAEILWEKGTNRSAFFRSEVAKYNWVDIGSSYLASEITAAYLAAQLEELIPISSQRKKQWNLYFQGLQLIKDNVSLPSIPDFAQHNGHIFYLLCRDKSERDLLIKHLSQLGFNAVFHYQSLHQSPYFLETQTESTTLPYCEKYSSTLLRLPLYYELQEAEQMQIIEAVIDFFGK